MPSNPSSSPRVHRPVRLARGVVSLATLCLLAAWPALAEEPNSSGFERAALRGQWFLDSFDPDKVHIGFRIRREGGDSNWGRSVPIARIEGLSPEALEQDSDRLTFRVVRDAGTFHCRGSIAARRGAGTFALALNPEFARELERRRVGRPTEEQQVDLALADAGMALLDALAATGYPKPDVSKFVLMAEHGVDEDYVRALADLGYRLGSLATLVEARDHGVHPHFIRGLQEAGYRDLSYEQLRTARDHGADPEYIRAMRGLGAGELSLEEMIQLRDHGVGPEYVKRMREAGYARVGLDELRVARDHGVDARYVEALSEAGFPRLSLTKVIRARDHGLSGSLARKAREQLGNDATIEDAIEWRNRGGR